MPRQIGGGYGDGRAQHTADSGDAGGFQIPDRQCPVPLGRAYPRYAGVPPFSFPGVRPKFPSKTASKFRRLRPAEGYLIGCPKPPKGGRSPAQTSKSQALSTVKRQKASDAKINFASEGALACAVEGDLVAHGFELVERPGLCPFRM